MTVFLFAATALAEPPASVEMQWAVKIPMRDGVHLNATVFQPAGQKDPLPVVFTLTPYLADSYLDRALYFARHGYVFALVDVRGRGNSEGTFEPFANDGRDGYDTVEWLAKQPWSNGKIAMWGGSYAGFDQWSTAKERPPHLATIVPAAAVHPGVDFPFFHNIFYSYDIQWLTFTSGTAPNAKLFGESAFWIDRFRDMYMNHKPFAEIDAIVGNKSTVFPMWLKHPTPDAYLDAMVPTPDAYRALDIPILTITGHYDGDQPGAFTYYRAHMKYGTADDTAKHYIIIGPWDHPATRTPRKEIGGLTFADASLVDLNKLHNEWYDWTMKGGPKPEFLKKRVAYYVTGAEEWKYADSLEAIPTTPQRFYLDSSATGASDAFHSGSLVSTVTNSAPDRWTYDPLDVRPAELDSEDIANNLTDQRGALRLYGEGAVYHSAPFEKDTELTGFVRFTASIAMDVPDSDLSVGLYEIKPDGSSVQLTGDLMRARYRDSVREAKLVKPGEINRYVFDGFTFISRRIAKGSRLRLVVGSVNTMFLEKNYNSGGDVAHETAKDARTAHITLYHDAQHPSFLELPLAQ
ncbi:MAG TPA: CocE/NonD family hydrolase [Thermoanaerobaculia bacterium]|nr:CocE/NonD family hydrolase [Thermoanaerobaculia bacterium]